MLRQLLFLVLPIQVLFLVLPFLHKSACRKTALFFFLHVDNCYSVFSFFLFAKRSVRVRLHWFFAVFFLFCFQTILFMSICLCQTVSLRQLLVFVFFYFLFLHKGTVKPYFSTAVRTIFFSFFLLHCKLLHFFCLQNVQYVYIYIYIYIENITFFFLQCGSGLLTEFPFVCIKRSIYVNILISTRFYCKQCRSELLH